MSPQLIEAIAPGDGFRSVYHLVNDDSGACSNHPMENLEVEDEEVSEVERLKDEGNEFFVSRRYQKALTK